MGPIRLGLELATWHSTWNNEAALAKQGNQVVIGLLYKSEKPKSDNHFAVIKYIRSFKNIVLTFISVKKYGIYLIFW